MPLTLKELTERRLLNELAQVFGMNDNAELLLFRAGFPRVFHPDRAPHPLAFWQQVCQMIENGVVAGTDLGSLLACAATMYPGNRHFKEFTARPLPQPVEPPTPSTQPPEAFLAYSTRDQAEVERIAIALRERGVSVWFDKWNLPGGTPLSRAIDKALRDIRCICVFVGSGDLGPWQQLEIEAAIALFSQNRDQKRIVPTLLRAASAKPHMPFALQAVSWVRFNDGHTFEDGVSELIRAIRAIS